MTPVPVVFLPGSLCDERVFADQIRDLTRPAQVADLTLDDSFAAMAARVLSEAPPRFVLVGLSMGAIVAAEIAESAPDRVVGMALIDCNLNAPDQHQLTTRQRWASDVRAGYFAKIVEEITPEMSISPEIHGALLVEMARSVGPAGFLRQNDALLVRHDRRPLVENFNGPILVACGRYDRLCPPEEHARLVSLAADGQLAIAESAGHLSTIDEPARLTSVLERWLQMCDTQKPRRKYQYEH